MFKFKYKYKYLHLKYKYKYKYFKTVFEYDSITRVQVISISIYYISAKYCSKC